MPFLTSFFKKFNSTNSATHILREAFWNAVPKISKFISIVVKVIEIFHKELHLKHPCKRLFKLKRSYQYFTNDRTFRSLLVDN